MNKQWHSVLKNYSFHEQKKLSLFNEHFQHRDFNNVHIIFLNTEQSQVLSLTHAQMMVIVSADVHLKIAFDVIPEQEVIINFLILDEAKVNLYGDLIIEKLSCNFFLGNSAQLNCYLAFMHKQHSIATIEYHLLGVRSCATLQGIYILDQAKTIDIFTKQYHYMPDTESNVSLKGFVTDCAKSMHQGLVTIDKGAQRANASHYNKTLIGKEDAQAKSIPSLEIKAHDVSCKHGSAIGYLDEQQLFYLKSRGFDEAHATKMLTEAFFADSDETLFTLVQEKLKKIL